MIRSLSRVVTLLLLAAAPLTAQPRIVKIPAKRALTHDSLWLMRRVGTPVPSPRISLIVAPPTVSILNPLEI